MEAFNAFTVRQILKKTPLHFFFGSSNGAMSGSVPVFRETGEPQGISTTVAFGPVRSTSLHAQAQKLDIK